MNSQHVIDAIYFLVVLNTVLCTDQNTSEIEVLDTCCSKGIGSQKALQIFTSTSTSTLCKKFCLLLESCLNLPLFIWFFLFFWDAKKKMTNLQCQVNTKVCKVFNEPITKGQNHSSSLDCSEWTVPIPKISQEHQSLCIATMEVCCIAAKRQTACQKGLQKAKDGLTCRPDVTAKVNPGLP